MKHLLECKINLRNLVIVSPDYGGVKRARKIAETIKVELAIVDKRRPKPNVVEVCNVLGEVNGKDCVLVDDMIDTGGTVLAAAQLLHERGAKSVSIMVTHALLNGKSKQKLKQALKDKVVDHVLITDTIPHEDVNEFEVVSISGLVAETLKVYMSGGSISHVYDVQLEKIKNGHK